MSCTTILTSISGTATSSVSCLDRQNSGTGPDTPSSINAGLISGLAGGLTAIIILIAMSTIFRRKLSAKHRLRKQRPSTVVKAAATAAAVETSLINPLNSVADRRSSLTNPSPLEIASAPQPSIKMSESSLFGGRVPLGSNVDDDGHVKSIEPLEVVAPLPAVVEAVGEDEAFAPTRILPTGLGGDNGGANQEQLNSPEGYNYL